MALNLATYTIFTKELEQVIQRLLYTDKYDSVNNLISLYEAYENSGMPLYDVYRAYTPPIRSHKHTCVGLGMELIRRWRCLGSKYPGLLKAVALLSCEEGVKKMNTYVRCAPGPHALLGAEKEHVMVAIFISLDGRPGILLSDPGYHLPSIVTIMEDGGYPSTGWFNQYLASDGINQHFYKYSMINRNYLEWHTLLKRTDHIQHKIALIYNKRPYYAAVNVTERRNLVYNNRSLISRDVKGRLTSGIYFKILPRYEDTAFTLFFLEKGKRKKKFAKFSDFDDMKSVDPSVLQHMKRISRYMRYRKGELFGLVHKLRKVLADTSFTTQLLEINNNIWQLSQAQLQHAGDETEPIPLPLPPPPAPTLQR